MAIAFFIASELLIKVTNSFFNDFATDAGSSTAAFLVVITRDLTLRFIFSIAETVSADKSLIEDFALLISNKNVLKLLPSAFNCLIVDEISRASIPPSDFLILPKSLLKVIRLLKLSFAALIAVVKSFTAFSVLLGIAETTVSFTPLLSAVLSTSTPCLLSLLSILLEITAVILSISLPNTLAVFFPIVGRCPDSPLFIAPIVLLATSLPISLANDFKSFLDIPIEPDCPFNNLVIKASNPVAAESELFFLSSSKTFFCNCNICFNSRLLSEDIFFLEFVEDVVLFEFIFISSV